MEATIQILKKSEKDNITYSISRYNDGTFRSYNFTGTLVALSNYQTNDGIDLSEDIVKANIPTTFIINNESIGEAIVEKAEEIYAKRLSNGNLNPAIELTVSARSLKIPTNILISGIVKAHINEDVILADTSDRILSQLQSAKNRKPKTQLNLAKMTAPKVEGKFSGIKTLMREYF